MATGLNSFQTLSQLQVKDRSYSYYNLAKAENKIGAIGSLPKSLKSLLENQLRFEDGKTTTAADVQALADWLKQRSSEHEIQFRPARVLMQDFTGVPAVVDLAAMRDAIVAAGGKPELINPLTPVDLVIDHSVMVDAFGNEQAFGDNVALEMKRNHERYQFLRWGQTAFDNFRVVPPGTGICHQVNLEYLAKTVWTQTIDGQEWAFPDTLVGTDSHTTMINGLAVLGWGVGGIEAEAAMLGQPVSMLIPEVVGFKLTGKLPEGITATDLVLTVTQMLRNHGVVGKFVEFYGDGLADLPLADRATLANMAPEYGATCGFFPVDEQTLTYLNLTGRSQQEIDLVEAYAKAQGLWRLAGDEPVFSQTLELDMNTVQASLAGPKRPQDKVLLADVAEVFDAFHAGEGAVKKTEKGRLFSEGGGGTAVGAKASLCNVLTDADTYTQLKDIHNGAVVIAAITSCTNTSNPSVMMAAGLLAKNAVEKGLQCPDWVKTSLAPGSKVVTDYLQAAGLTAYLDQLGFNLVGYGCTTCIGNSGPLPKAVEQAIADQQLTVAAVLSGNRNFEGRIHPLVKANWLGSPPLVIAYALAGTVRIDISRDPLGVDAENKPVYLRDVWPTPEQIATAMTQVRTEQFVHEYAHVFDGDAEWQAIKVPESQTYAWRADSTYIQQPPFFDPSIKAAEQGNIVNARALAVFGDSVTTDHISPAGNIAAASPAGEYLLKHNITPTDFNSYGSRRGNHEVMMRGTFANIRIHNLLLDGVEGGYTRYFPTGEQLPIYDAAMRYQADETALIVLAGKEYGTGSSRDWAAKGTRLIGVSAVIAESFERIHRSNLIGMGVLPLEFADGASRESLGISGNETFQIDGLDGELSPHMSLTLRWQDEDGQQHNAPLLSRIDTLNEVEYFKAGGILHYVLKNLLKAH